MMMTTTTKMGLAVTRKRRSRRRRRKGQEPVAREEEEEEARARRRAQEAGQEGEEEEGPERAEGQVLGVHLFWLRDARGDQGRAPGLVARRRRARTRQALEGAERRRQEAVPRPGREGRGALQDGDGGLQGEAGYGGGVDPSLTIISP